MTVLANFFDEPGAHLREELVQTLMNAAAVRIERIVSHGHASPPGFWFDQDQHEWVMVLQGAARLQLEGEEPIAMNRGDFMNIPAHKKHRVDWTIPDEPTIWLAVHYGAQQPLVAADVRWWRTATLPSSFIGRIP